MFMKMLKSKLHRARVTETKLHYAGSIAIDSDLMEAVGLLPYESVFLADVNNGARLETYVVPAPAGSKDVIIMGAAAQVVAKGDIVIIFSFAFLTPEEAKTFKPQVVALDEKNNIEKRIS
ncbi:MAG: aspartate 1-decarboxylase [Planctomycetota bacterium]|jgi:aspartate 1-decarboxylase